MPTYVYACDKCGHKFEARQSFSDSPLESCPECTGRIRRVIHPTGVIFKGSGWYVTDSRKQASSSNGNGAEPSESKSTEKPATSVAADD